MSTSSSSATTETTTTSTGGATTTNSTRRGRQATQQQSDGQWLKVMETKESQWRYLHSLALHEMNWRERAACDQLHDLCTRLNELVEACDKTERVVRRCRTHRFQQEVVRVATKPVQQAVAHLSAARYISSANDMIDSMQHSIKVNPNNNNHDHVLAELEKFRVEALRFRTVAKDVGLVQLIGLASSLEKLANMVADEASMVNDTARHVHSSGRNAELARTKMLHDVVQRSKIDATEQTQPQPQLEPSEQPPDRSSSVPLPPRPS